MDKIYFDYASTTPVDPQVIAAMQPFFFEQFGNPSSPHGFGRAAQKALEESRIALAKFLNAKPEEIVFTASATESNNAAIMGVARALKTKGNHIIASKIEHHSVLGPVEYLLQEGFKVTLLDVDEFGVVNPEDVRKAITDKTILVAVMHASNEIGTIQPVAEIGSIAREKGIPFLVDAVQTVGHLPVNVQELNVDLLSVAAHKFYGPKGIGALYIRPGTRIWPFLLGGDQEKGRRASTQNVAGAVGLAKAIELCSQVMSSEAQMQCQLRDRIISFVTQNIPDVRLNGHPKKRLPNNAHFSFGQLHSESLLMSLDMNEIAASMGSACTAGSMEPSHVLRAIGLSDELAFGALRISLGRWTTAAHVDYFLEQLPTIVKRVRI